MDFSLYFQILLIQWQGVMGVLEFLVPFYPINTARVVSSSDLKMDPLNLYPNYNQHFGLRQGEWYIWLDIYFEANLS